MAVVMINGTQLSDQEVSVIKVALETLEMEITEPADTPADTAEDATETEVEVDDDIGLTEAYLAPIYRMQLLLG